MIYYEKKNRQEYKISRYLKDFLIRRISFRTEEQMQQFAFEMRGQPIRLAIT